MTGQRVIDGTGESLEMNTTDISSSGMWFSGSYAYSTGSPLYSDALNSETAPFAGLIALVDGSGEPSARRVL